MHKQSDKVGKKEVDECGRAPNKMKLELEPSDEIIVISDEVSFFYFKF